MHLSPSQRGGGSTLRGEMRIIPRNSTWLYLHDLCFCCGCRGHFARQCPFREEGDEEEMEGADAGPGPSVPTLTNSPTPQGASTAAAGNGGTAAVDILSTEVRQALSDCFGPRAPSRKDLQTSFGRQFPALLKKRFNNTRRDRRTLCHRHSRLWYHVPSSSRRGPSALAQRSWRATLPSLRQLRAREWWLRWQRRQ